MTKKIFAQPEMTVVEMRNNDIVTLSDPKVEGKYNGTSTILAPGQRDINSWYEGY